MKYTVKEAYFKKYGEPVKEESFILKDVRRFFNNCVATIHSMNPNLNIELIEINDLSLNASAIRTGKNSYSIILRSGIIDIIWREYGQNYELFEDLFEIFSCKEDTMAFYLLYIYSYIIGHELGHIVYGHFTINESKSIIKEISEQQNIIFNISENEFLEEFKDNIRFFLELSADTYGIITLSDMLVKNVIRAKYESKNWEEGLIRILINSLYLIQNLFKINHTHKSNYPDPIVRISFIISLMQKLYCTILKIDSIKLQKICNNQLTLIMDLQDKFNLRNYQLDETISKDIKTAEDEFHLFAKKLEKYHLI